jgi:proteasome lid subunit RPN8/RPN11
MRLAQDHYDALIGFARAALPHEACGLLAGEDGMVREVLPLTNVEHNPDDCGWRADSREQYRAFERMDDREWRLFAVYHSHPRSAAYPSERDIEHALYPDACYVVVSLLDADAPDVRAFRISGGIVSDEPLAISGDAPAPVRVAKRSRLSEEA